MTIKNPKVTDRGDRAHENEPKYASSKSNAKVPDAKNIPAHKGSGDNRGQGAEVER